MLGLLGEGEKGSRRRPLNTWSLCFSHAKCCWPFYSFSVVEKCSRDHSARWAKPTRGENWWAFFPTFFLLCLGSWYCWSGGIRVVPWYCHGNRLEEKLRTWQTGQWCHQQVWWWAWHTEHSPYWILRNFIQYRLLQIYINMISSLTSIFILPPSLFSLRPGSPESSDLDEHLRSEAQQKQADSSTPPASDSTCVAARTRPLLSCRKRRVLRPGSLTSLSRKVGETCALAGFEDLYTLN